MTSSDNDLASVIGAQRLELLRQASKRFPIPGIESAARAALRTLSLVLSIVGRHRANLIAIGREACVITVNVVKRVDLDGSGNAVHSKYTMTLERDSATLVKEMEAIERDIANHRNSGGFKRISFARASDSRVVDACRARLSKALRLFELQSDIDLRQQMALLDQNLQAMLDKHDQLQAPSSSNPPYMPSPPHSSNPPYMPSPPHSPNPPYMPSPPHSPNLPHMPSRPHSPNPPYVPSSTPQPYPPDSLIPAWPQPSIPSYDLGPSFPQPTSLSTPSWTPNNEVTQALSREERKAARHARKEARAARHVQHATNVTGFTSSPDAPAPYSTFANIQNHISPNGNISYHYVNGNVVNSSRDDSFKVSGSGNKIDISFTRNP